MNTREKRLKMRVFIKTFLYLNRGKKYTAKELAAKLNETNIGIRDGVLANELAAELQKTIKVDGQTTGFLKDLCYERVKSRGVYYLKE